MSIPKRPDASKYSVSEFNQEMIEYHYCVAKRAVEALKNLSVYAAADYDGMNYKELSDYALLIVREIEASGWKE